jgi:ornithine cyclodeaminase/alanine dehydrogenase
LSTLRYLSAADVDTSLPTIAEQLVIAEQALIALVGDAAEVPPKIGVHPRPGAVVHAMPAFGKGADVVGMKMISTYPANPSRQLPPNDALILLDDPETGVAHTLMDGRRITALRTAAISGVAMRHFRPASVERIVLIGAGNQGHTHTAIVEELFPDRSSS